MKSLDDFREFCLLKGAKEVFFESPNYSTKFTLRGEPVKLPNRKWNVSDKGLFSIKYANCNGIVLLGSDKVCGLTHQSDTDLHCASRSGQPFHYLSKVMKRMNKIDKAVLLAGDHGHQIKIKAYLERHNIPVEAEFCDGWSNTIAISLGLDKYIGQKGLLVLPDEREVYMFSNVDTVGFKQLL